MKKNGKGEDVRVLGWRKGREYVMVSDCPKRLMQFAEIMDTTEYLTEDKKGK